MGMLAHIENPQQVSQQIDLSDRLDVVPISIFLTGLFDAILFSFLLHSSRLGALTTRRCFRDGCRADCD
jgi:hypothetical protein